MIEVKELIYLFLLFIATINDLKNRRISNLIIGAVLILALIYNNIISVITGGLILALPFFIVSVLTSQGRQLTIGGGDIKLFFAIGGCVGIYLGFIQCIFSLVLAIVYGFVYSKIKSVGVKSVRLPLAPFIFLGNLLMIIVIKYL